MTEGENAFDEERLRELDEALHNSARFAGVLFEDDRVGLIPDDPPPTEGPLPEDPVLRATTLKARDIERRIGELPEIMRWIPRADYRLEGDTVCVVAGEVELGTWADAEFNEVIRRWRKAAG